MKYSLIKIPEGVFRDIYGRPEIIANRMAWINKDYYYIIENIIGSSIYNNSIVITDIYRKPQESLIARRKKGKMVAPPGLSGHNYGISIDVDIESTEKKLNIKKHELYRELETLGLNNISTESWHFNLGVMIASDYYNRLYYSCPKNFLKDVGKKFVSHFNDICNLSCQTVQDTQIYLMLKPDGIIGKRTFLAASAIMSEAANMLNVNTTKDKELLIDYEYLWKPNG